MEFNFTLSERDLTSLRALAQKPLALGNTSSLAPVNGTETAQEEDLDVNTDIYSKVFVTVIYVVLFAVGCLGNSITLYTLTKKSLQNLQSTVHYHLTSLAVSDLLILVLCMPIELYNFIWFHHPWVFGQAVCKGYYFLRDGCSYATALNIASLSVERYMAICHPFKAKSIMSRSRTKKLISAMWLASLLLASPMLFTMGLEEKGEQRETLCTSIVSHVTMKTVLQAANQNSAIASNAPFWVQMKLLDSRTVIIGFGRETSCTLVNALLSFVVPMAAISALNGIIATQLLRMFKEAEQDNRVCIVGGNPTMLSVTVEPNRAQSLRHGVMVLRAVVIAFVVCWLPYHARRLMFCYVTEWTDGLFDFYHYFYMVTNVLFYVSSAINPVLYNLVSANYRQTFLSTLRCLFLPCQRRRRRAHRRVLTRHSLSMSSNHTLSTNIVKETAY